LYSFLDNSLTQRSFRAAIARRIFGRKFFVNMTFSWKFLRGCERLSGFVVAFWICAGLRAEFRDVAEKIGEEIS